MIKPPSPCRLSLRAHSPDPGPQVFGVGVAVAVFVAVGLGAVGFSSDEQLLKTKAAMKAMMATTTKAKTTGQNDFGLYLPSLSLSPLPGLILHLLRCR